MLSFGTFTIFLSDTGEIDQWLGDHPAVLGGVIVGACLILVISGLWGLKTGKTRSKFNTELTGSRAVTTSWLRIVGGLVFGAWGVYLFFS